MALSLDDKLLGEKTHYYCSSSEDEGGSDTEEGAAKSESKGPVFVPEEALKDYDGSCTNVSFVEFHSKVQRRHVDYRCASC